MKKSVAIYARVSTAEQHSEPQLAELRAYAARREFHVAGEYVDTVTGDATKSRKDEAFQRLMKDAQLRKFDCVLVWKYDRFARSLGILIQSLNTFSCLGIDFISITQSIDTTTPMGRLFFHVIGSFAEFEREMIVERVRAGINHARARGTRLGRPRDVAVEAQILKLHARGMSYREVARAVHRSPAGVLKIVKKFARCEASENSQNPVSCAAMKPEWLTRMRAGDKPE